MKMLLFAVLLDVINWATVHGHCDPEVVGKIRKATAASPLPDDVLANVVGRQTYLYLPEYLLQRPTKVTCAQTVLAAAKSSVTDWTFYSDATPDQHQYNLLEKEKGVITQVYKDGTAEDLLYVAFQEPPVTAYYQCVPACDEAANKHCHYQDFITVTVTGYDKGDPETGRKVAAAEAAVTGLGRHLVPVKTDCDSYH